eukprot:TRINITY_DN2765_c0_g1_i6.p1 TRINITY_DN2765_c0_g1~~TRINITY_DN2765_c0_g1_i6.p1  ORF type:complete len:273 (+),score=82.08 TRINITY_DN2765_c0_g1_i6:75-893(+)
MMFFILTILATATTSLAQEAGAAEETNLLAAAEDLSGAEEVTDGTDLPDKEKALEEYLKACSTLGIQPISIVSGSFTQPGYSSGYTYPSTGYSSYGGSSNYPYGGYYGSTGYPVNYGYSGNTGYSGYPSYTSGYYPSYNGYNGGYTYNVREKQAAGRSASSRTSVAEEAPSETAGDEKAYEEYVKACTTLGIQPISIGSGSYTQPSYSSGYNYPSTGYINYGGSSNYPYSGYSGSTGYPVNYGYSGSSGYYGNTGYPAYTSGYYPSYNGYTG